MSVISANPPSTARAALYAYRHVSTNQVLYTLGGALKAPALQQLPDLGANRTPRSIRRDLWRPYFSVHFDQGRSNIARQVYEKLLKWRKLHEVSWTPPAELSLPYSEKQIEAIREDLYGKGGSKIENPYDRIKNYKEKLKARIIMDQRANSVADLAKVLLQKIESEESLQRKAQNLVHQLSAHDLEDIDRQIEKLRQHLQEETRGPPDEVLALRKQRLELEARLRVVDRRSQKTRRVELSKEIEETSAKLLEMWPGGTKTECVRSLQELKTLRKAVEFAKAEEEKHGTEPLRHRLEALKKELQDLRTKREKEVKDFRAERKPVLRQLLKEQREQLQAEADHQGSESIMTATQVRRASSPTRREVFVPAAEAFSQSPLREAFRQSSEAFKAKRDELRTELGSIRRRFRAVKYKPLPTNLHIERWLPTPVRRSGITERIEIRWEHQPDMAFAKKWPKNVTHRWRISEMERRSQRAKGEQPAAGPQQEEVVA